jgi:pimeloyl-ACP methyl ester carboxylesterase
MDAAAIDRYRAAEHDWWQSVGWAPDEHWVLVEGRRVRVLTSGDGSPVLFVHGGPNAGSTWAELAALVERSGHRAIVVDRPGCGLSEPLDLPPALDSENWWGRMADVLSAVVDAHASGRADIVASSFGGGCALSLAHRQPERVRRLVVEGAPTLEGMAAARNMRMLAIGPLGRFIARQKATIRSTRMTFRQIGHERLVDSGWPQGPGAAWGLSMMNDTDTMRNEVAMIQLAATWRRFRPGSLVPTTVLPEIQAPALWLVGDNDPFASVSVMRGWSESMANSRLEVRAGSGHLPWLDEPAWHAEQITAFLHEGGLVSG